MCGNQGLKDFRGPHGLRPDALTAMGGEGGKLSERLPRPQSQARLQGGKLAEKCRFAWLRVQQLPGDPHDEDAPPLSASCAVHARILVVWLRSH